ncbi:MAG: hypothetical protein U0168_13775 [Nannocystaceae bacterium]
MRFSYGGIQTMVCIATRARVSWVLALVAATACGGSDGGTGTSGSSSSEGTGSGSTTGASTTTVGSASSEGSSGTTATTGTGDSSGGTTTTGGSDSGSGDASTSASDSGSSGTDTGAIEPNPACVAGCAVEFECGTEWGSARECVTWCDANLDAAAMFAQACRDAWEDLSACFGTLSCEDFQAYQAAEVIPYPCQSEAESLSFECDGQ